MIPPTTVHGRQGLRGLCAALALMAVPPLAAQPAAGSAPTNLVRLVEMAGVVEVAAPPGTDWIRTQTNQVLRPFYRLRTGANSRAALRWSDQSVVPLGELTEIEILPSHARGAEAGLHLVKGVLSFFHRDKPGRIRVITAGTIAGIEGTEFVMEVASVDNTERATLSVIDGRVSFGNEQDTLTLTNGQQAIADISQAPVRTAGFLAENILQWAFYYPAVLDLRDLPLTRAEQDALADSLAAYRAGDLLAALAAYPANRQNVSDTERVYHAALLLAVGQVEKAEPVLKSLPKSSPLQPLVSALETLIAAVKRQPVGTRSTASDIDSKDAVERVPAGTTTELFAASYFEQSRAHGEASLTRALALARRAAVQSPDFGFAWARTAELEFSFGRTREAQAALQQSLTLAPRNAQALVLRGFLLAAQNQPRAALDWFEQALAVDSALGNAWLGRGLCKIRLGYRLFGIGHSTGGEQDLLIAAALEPRRALLRSYLGKAWADAGDSTRAFHELDLAQHLDPADPTAWLYSALLRQQDRQFNAGIRDLEHSQDLSDNRHLYRSQLLLDQDRAVRSANLAALYRDAGLTDVSVREAARAVTADYANSSAHLFLAESFDALRDPTRFNLRHETVWFNELLLANLLAPVGAGHLSQSVSQQEYSRLFERDGMRLFNSTEYRSDGQFRELASVSGTFGKTGYALDLDYQHNEGVRPNNELSRLEMFVTAKHQLTARDSLFLLAKYQDFHAGDNFQYFDPREAQRRYQADETQEPLLLGAYHREWSPGFHTLFAAARLINDQRVENRGVNQLLLATNGAGAITNVGEFLIDTFGNDVGGLDLNYRSRFEIYSFELNQILQRTRHTDVLGVRYQTGEFNTRQRLFNVTPSAFSNFFVNPPASGKFTEDFERVSFYGYHTWEPVERLFLTAGLAYDRITFPRNYRRPPLSAGSERRDQLSPKAAVVWQPLDEVTLRGVYTRSLGGVSFDESFRLEPTQLAGFSQAFRTIIPESVAGSVSAPEYDTAGAALDLALKTRTYLGLEGDYLRSQIDRTIGAFDYGGAFTPGGIGAASTRETLDYTQRSAAATVNQLLSEEWSVGLQYRFTRSELQRRFPAIARSVLSGLDRQADLHNGQAFALFNHSSGFFARWESHYYQQDNSHLRGESFFQHHLFAGYRFPRRRAELMVGLMNLTDQDYRLNPLTPYAEMPRERVFVGRVKFQF